LSEDAFQGGLFQILSVEGNYRAPAVRVFQGYMASGLVVNIKIGPFQGADNLGGINGG